MNQLPQFILNKYQELKKLKQNENFVLHLDGVDKIYDNGFQAVFDINIKLKKGNFLALLGPSGCGKSTTLRMIAGLEKVSQGDVYINNVNVTEAEPEARDLTMVFQNYALFPHLSVKNNIIFGLKANKKKIGQSGIVYKEINVLKSKINIYINLIKDIKNLKKNQALVIKLKKRLNVLQSKYEIALKNDPCFKTKLTKKMRVEVSRLKSFIEFGNKKNNVLVKQVNNIDLYLNEIKKLKNQILNLEIKRKKVALNDDVNKIINNKANEAAKLLELDYLMDRKPAQLSGGQRQRVALGRSIVGNPNLFLMDEPLSNLDAKLRATMRSEIKKLHQKINSGTIYVTHDQIEAMTMADQIAVMSDGFILQVGTPNEIFRHPSTLFVGSFVGSPEMNLLNGKIENNTFVSDLGLKINLLSYKIKNTINFQKVTLGIRPTDLSFDCDVYNAYHVKWLVRILTKELLGNEIQYKVKIIDFNKRELKFNELTIISSAYEDYSIGKEIYLYPLLSRIHLFDSKTTIALTSEFNLETIQALKTWINAKEKIAIRRELLEAAKTKSNQKKIIYKIRLKTKNYLLTKINDLKKIKKKN